MPAQPAGQKGKGGKKKRRGQKGGPGGAMAVERGLVLSDGPQQQYAQASKMLGDRRILARCYDGSGQYWTDKLIHIRGKFRKRVYVNIGDYVLVSTREFETGDAPSEAGTTSDLPFGGDVIHVYNQNEVRKLVKMGEFVPEETETDATEAKNSKLQFMDSDDERDFVAKQNTKKHSNLDDDDNDDNDEDGPKRVAVAPQQRCLDMPASDDSDSMDADALKRALETL